MTDGTAPDQQPSGQPVAPAPPTPAGENWELRYKGMVPVVEKLTLDNRNLQAQLTALASEKEQLAAQLGLKDTEKSAAVGERDKQLQQLIQTQTSLEQEMARLKALELKVKVANKIGDPGLMAIADSIPSVADEEALTTLMKNISEWGQSAARQREAEILAGVTKPVVSVEAPALPNSIDAWQKYVNDADLGTPEREKRMNAWRDWGLSLNK